MPMDFGMVGANETVITCDVMPFGGVKQSGIGREFGSFGLDAFLEPRTVLA